MKKNLIIDIYNKDLAIAFGLSKCLISVKKYILENTGDLNQSIENFLKKNVSNPSNISNTILMYDVSNLLLHDKKKHKTAYIRSSHSSIQYSPINTLLQNIGVITKVIHPLDIREKPEKLKMFLKKFKKRGIKRIILNFSYPLLQNDNTGEIIEFCEKMYPGMFEYYLPSNTQTSDLLIFENELVLNGLFEETITPPLQSIENTLHSFGIYSPIFIYTGSGTLLHIKAFLKSSLSSWQSRINALITGAARFSNQANAVIILTYKNEMYIGLISNFRPRLKYEEDIIQKLTISGEFPSLIKLPSNVDEKTLIDYAQTMNPCMGPLPIINLTENAFAFKTTIRYPVINIGKRFFPVLSGMLYSRYKYTQIKLLPKNISLEMFKNDFLNKTFSELKQNNILLNNSDNIFKLSSIKYLQNGSNLIRLTVSGDIQHGASCTK